MKYFKTFESFNQHSGRFHILLTYNKNFGYAPKSKRFQSIAPLTSSQKQWLEEHEWKPIGKAEGTVSLRTVFIRPKQAFISPEYKVIQEAYSITKIIENEDPEFVIIGIADLSTGDIYYGQNAHTNLPKIFRSNSTKKVPDIVQTIRNLLDYTDIDRTTEEIETLRSLFPEEMHKKRGTIAAKKFGM